ncbi:hypothetical protein UNSWCS_1498 [Campylobacter concisus UNSWCS]|uniref:Uncharacterized protein n=1 Tax=Campylobacter concisus UNSWCS TaxID=1242968 RepID=U2EXV5_9BACT|nr:hypothetical protein UNSWCS_1498 [Campylobacter concisus UNSWCS]
MSFGSHSTLTPKSNLLIFKISTIICKINTKDKNGYTKIWQ